MMLIKYGHIAGTWNEREASRGLQVAKEAVDADVVKSWCVASDGCKATLSLKISISAWRFAPRSMRRASQAVINGSGPRSEALT